MIRPVFTELALFAIPFAIYGIFLLATRRGLMDPASWPLLRVVWLFIAALLFVLGGFVAFAQFGGAPPHSTYTPARFENGKLIPGSAK
jgi:hypothetical protein